MNPMQIHSQERDGYSYHKEADEVGGEIYVRCEECGRELLVELGGIDQLVHKDGCPNSRDNR